MRPFLAVLSVAVLCGAAAAQKPKRDPGKAQDVDVREIHKHIKRCDHSDTQYQGDRDLPFSTPHLRRNIRSLVPTAKSEQYKDHREP